MRLKCPIVVSFSPSLFLLRKFKSALISAVPYKAWTVPDQTVILEECLLFVFVNPVSLCRWIVWGQIASLCVCERVFNSPRQHSWVWEGPSPQPGCESTAFRQTEQSEEGGCMHESVRRNFPNFFQRKDFSPPDMLAVRLSLGSSSEISYRSCWQCKEGLVKLQRRSWSLRVLSSTRAWLQLRLKLTRCHRWW